MKHRTAAAVAVIAAAAAIPLAGCSAYSAAHDYNAPTPSRVIPGDWTRIETPGNFPSVVWECVGRDGIYVNMDTASSAWVVADDPNCKPGADIIRAGS